MSGIWDGTQCCSRSHYFNTYLTVLQETFCVMPTFLMSECPNGFHNRKWWLLQTCTCMTSGKICSSPQCNDRVLLCYVLLCIRVYCFSARSTQYSSIAFACSAGESSNSNLSYSYTWLQTDQKLPSSGSTLVYAWFLSFRMSDLFWARQRARSSIFNVSESLFPIGSHRKYEIWSRYITQQVGKSQDVWRETQSLCIGWSRVTSEGFSFFYEWSRRTGNVRSGQIRLLEVRGSPWRSLGCIIRNPNNRIGRSESLRRECWKKKGLVSVSSFLRVYFFHLFPFFCSGWKKIEKWTSLFSLPYWRQKKCIYKHMFRENMESICANKHKQNMESTRATTIHGRGRTIWQKNEKIQSHCTLQRYTTMHAA
jgi:hypothetical protein